MELEKIFEKLVVVELANVLAGPSVGMFFAELGARVLKVENKLTGGDVTRTWRLKSENTDSDVSAYFASVNYGKEFVQLDLREDTDLAYLYKEIKKADILISSYKVGDDKKLKVDYETLKKINPKLIYGHITGYGIHTKRSGYDAIIQAESGFMFMNGDTHSQATKMPVALVDILAAHQLKEAILVSLLKRTDDGNGSYCHVSLMESAISSLANQATNYLMANHIPQRIGSEHPNIVPYGSVFQTKDGKNIVLAIGTDKQFYEFSKIIGRLDLAESELFQQNQNRVKNREGLLPILEKELKSWKQQELLDQCLLAGVPCGAVNSMEDLFKLPIAEKMILRGKDMIAVKSVAFKRS